MPKLAVVADDLTGATDTAHAFAARGYRTRVAVGPDDVPKAPVVAVNADTRTDDAQSAASTVRRLVAGLDAAIYVKVDSTLRGNVVAEIDAAVRASDADVAIVAPAFPATGRTTRDGIHYVDGVRIDETAYASDDKGPDVARLPALLADSRYPVVHAPVEVVERGPDAIAARFGDDRPVLVACDATRDDHLATIARSGDRAGGRVVYAGSGGLAEHVAVADELGSRPTVSIAEGSETPPVVTDVDDAVLGIVGSVNERTLAGLGAVSEDDVVEIESALAVEDPTAAGRAAGTEAGRRLAARETAVVTGARRRSAVDSAHSAGEALGLGPDEVKERVRRSLAVAARTAVDREPPAGLFLTGGDVAVAVLASLGATTLTMTGTAIEAGIPVAVVHDGVAANRPVVTKAGGFGDEETVVNCLRTLAS